MRFVGVLSSMVLVVAMMSLEAGTALVAKGRALATPSPGVYVMPADGTGERRLARTESAGFSWSPDGSSVVLAIGGEFTRGDDLFIAPAVGGPLQRLTRTPRIEEAWPAWSPDGLTVAYDGTNDSEYVRTRIWTVGADGSQRKRLSPLTDFSETSAAWAPDSRRMAFLHDMSANQFNVHSMTSNGTGRRALTRELREEEWAIAWSPTGTHIAFLRTTNALRLDRTTNDLWVMRSDGTKERRLARNVAEATPSWRHDGQQIAYAANGAVWVANLPTGKTRRVGTPGVAEEVAWSPDGASLAVVSRLGEDRTDLYLVVAEGKGPTRRLTNDGGPEETNPLWSPDGSMIGFARRSF